MEPGHLIHRLRPQVSLLFPNSESIQAMMRPCFNHTLLTSPTTLGQIKVLPPCFICEQGTQILLCLWRHHNNGGWRVAFIKRPFLTQAEVQVWFLACIWKLKTIYISNYRGSGIILWLPQCSSMHVALDATQTKTKKKKNQPRNSNMEVNITSTMPVDRGNSPKGSCLLAANKTWGQKISNSR